MPNSTTSRGRFGIHGGQYIPETLMNAVIELEEALGRSLTAEEIVGIDSVASVAASSPDASRASISERSGVPVQ